ncbi:unnamed protein product [Nezara viridula]|uniref:Neuropeptide n=1 Tax=Nezara viridula TaxID=85310 RepID=A0A9P0E4Q9_NEZVI|nr:unnamed protein product [Nezara viridula]
MIIRAKLLSKRSRSASLSSTSPILLLLILVNHGTTDQCSLWPPKLSYAVSHQLRVLSRSRASLARESCHIK